MLRALLHPFVIGVFMAPTGETGFSRPLDGNEIVRQGFDPSAPTGEGGIVMTADGRKYRVVLGEAPNVIRNGRVEPR